jgi:D-erythro-7,8-dihydroneopterin triphosphate epimerase
MDRILINDLRARCIIGVNESERHEKQDVIVNLELWADLSKPCRSDDFADTVDYSAIKKRVLAAVEASQHFLIEALSQEIADICLSFPLVRKVRVILEKPTALRFTRSVAVDITREQTN